jgi:hypothetical protein
MYIFIRKSQRKKKTRLLTFLHTILVRRGGANRKKKEKDQMLNGFEQMREKRKKIPSQFRWGRKNKIFSQKTTKWKLQMHETGIRPANNFRVDKARRWPDGPIYCGRSTSQQGSASSQHTHKFEAKKKRRKEKKTVWWQTPCIIYIQHGWKKSDGTLASVFLEIGRERPGDGVLTLASCSAHHAVESPIKEFL